MPALRRWSPYAFKAALVLGVAVGGLWTATHGVAGVRWMDVGAALRAVAPWRLAVLALIWVGGLGIYSLVLSAALPGLGVRRSLLLNLSGSAVANVVPLGGAVATALNWRMVKAWGHSDAAFVAFCLLTNALDVLTKLALPLVAMATLVAISAAVPSVLWVAAGGSAGVFAAALAVRALVRRHSSPGALSIPRRAAAIRDSLRDSGARISSVVVRRWPQLVPASLAYVAAQVLLLGFALRSVGLQAPLTVVLTAAAIERLGTLVPLTPGGTGVAEVGTIAWLIAAGQDPAASVAGVLVYRLFLIVMEIPVGGLLLGGWMLAQRRPAARGRVTCA